MWYQVQWCEMHEGETEVTLKNRKRVDCETNTHVIEFDFADKWRESIGQALSYAMLTDKKAGIVLILETKSDHQNFEDLQKLIAHFDLPIDIWSTP